MASGGGGTGDTRDGMGTVGAGVVHSPVRGRVNSDQLGLNPNRVRGFGGNQFPRIETPRLTDMRAKQGAVVARF